MVRIIYRDALGRFATRDNAIKFQKVFKTGRFTKVKEIAKLEIFARPWMVHAKLEMTKGKGGGTIEMEAVNVIVATDREAAKEILLSQIIARFPGLEFSKIRLFANPASMADTKHSGRITWRSEGAKRSGRPSRQLTIPPFL